MDYRENTTNIYKEFASSLISEQCDLNILSMCGVSVRDASSSSLPSWVPDGSQEVFTTTSVFFPTGPYHAADQALPCSSFENDLSVLLDGVLLSKVEFLCRPWIPEGVLRAELEPIADKFGKTLQAIAEYMYAAAWSSIYGNSTISFQANIWLSQAAELINPAYASQISTLSLAIYLRPHLRSSPGHRNRRHKFEFALDYSTDTVVLVGEVLTPDSSRCWPAATYQVGKSQESLDRQVLRDWLGKAGLEGVELPKEVVEKTLGRYEEAFEKIVGKPYRDVAGDSR